MRTLSLLALLAVPACAGPARGADSPAPVAAAEKAFPAFGAKTPEFKPSAWLRGEAPKNLADGEVHLIFCWSTLSANAVKAVPAMNDLHRRFAGKGASVAGVSVWEESESVVRDFMRLRGEAMAFPVAFDGRDAAGTVSKRWLEDTGINGIPYVFAVKSGRVLWHGTPDELDADTVASMVAGTYDIAKTEARIAAEQAAREKGEPLFSEIEDLIMDRKFDDALARCDTLEKMLPPRDRPSVSLSRAQAFFGKGDFEKGYAQVAAYVDAHPNDPDLQAMTALSLVAEPAFESHRNFALAKRLVDRALAIAPIDPYRMLSARVAYTAGDKAGALKILDALKTTTDMTVHAQLKLAKVAVDANAPWPIPHKTDCACGAH